MYSTKVLGDDYEYKGCDLVTLDIYDDEDFVGAKLIGTGNWSYFKWDIPAGSYTEDYAYDHPAIITVQLVGGSARLAADSFYIQYLNGVKNQYSTDKIPVLAYTSKRASNSHHVTGVGELIVNEKPTVLRLRLLESDRVEEAVNVINGLKLTLKYSYYVKKPSRIEPAPPNRFA
jgi:hypothetical protein